MPIVLAAEGSAGVWIRQCIVCRQMRVVLVKMCGSTGLVNSELHVQILFLSVVFVLPTHICYDNLSEMS